MTSLTYERALTVTLTTKSDWAIGTGHGRHGGVDAVVERDADGLPFVRGKMLSSLLYDEARALVQGLDEQQEMQPWLAWLDHLFGSRPSGPRGTDIAASTSTAPRASILRTRPLTLEHAAHLSHSAHGLSPAELKRSLFTIRSNVKITTLSGTAADESLRTVERVMGGTTLTATWTMIVPGEPSNEPTALPNDWPALVLLLGSAHALEHFGADRRRGAGRCELAIEIDDQGGARGVDSLWSRLVAEIENENPIPSPPSPLDERTRTPRLEVGETISDDAGGQLVPVFDLVLDVVDPLIVNGGTRGNVLESLDVVPGTLLLPIIARALGPVASELIREGRLVVTDAVLELDGARSTPWPESLLVSKDDAQPDQAHDAVRTAPPNARWKSRVGHRLSPPRREQNHDGHPMSIAARVPLLLRMHNAVDPDADRPTSRSGGPFAYTGIAPGERLRSTVWLPAKLLDEAGVARVQTELTRDVRLGTSKKDDYGSVRLTAARRTGVEPNAVHPSTHPAEAGSLLRVLLESDLLATDEFGEAIPTAHGVVVALQAAGLPVALAPFDAGGDAKAAIATALVRARRRESWHVGWGLPRPSLVTVQAGGVVVVSAERDINSADLARVVRDGIGDRRAEGFGRVLVQPLAEVPETVKLGEVSPSTSKKGRAATDNSAGAGLPVDSVLVQRAWKQRISDACEIFAADSTLRQKIVPSGIGAAQRGNLREAAMSIRVDARREGGLDRDLARAWFESATRSIGSSPWPKQTLETLAALFAHTAHPTITVWHLLDLGSDLKHVREAVWITELEREALVLLITLSVRAENSARKGKK